MPHRDKAWNGRRPNAASSSVSRIRNLKYLVANYRREAFSPPKMDRMDPSSVDVLRHLQMNNPQPAPLSPPFLFLLGKAWPPAGHERVSPLRGSQGLSCLVGNQTQSRTSHDAGARLSLSLCPVSLSGRSTFSCSNY